MIEYIENIILPYVDSNREHNDMAVLIIMDNFTGQITPKVMDLLEKSNIHTCLLPPNTTDKLQPLDISVNKPAKEFLRLKFQEWYAEQIRLGGCHVELEPVDLGLLVMKELRAKWLEEMYQYICDNPQFIVNGFLKAGIPKAVEGQFDNDSEIDVIFSDDSNNDITNTKTAGSNDESDDSLSNQNTTAAPGDVIELLDTDSEDL